MNENENEQGVIEDPNDWVSINIKVRRSFRDELSDKLSLSGLKVGFVTRLFWREYIEDSIIINTPKVFPNDESTISRTDTW